VFVTASHLYPSLIFVGKAGIIYLTTVEDTDTDKHSSLLWFLLTPKGLYHKTFYIDICLNCCKLVHLLLSVTYTLV